jgi:LysM repeat protein
MVFTSAPPRTTSTCATTARARRSWGAGAQPLMPKGKPELNFTVHRIRTATPLGKLALRYDTSIKAIQKANGMKGTYLRAGRTLTIRWGPPARLPGAAGGGGPAARLPPTTPASWSRRPSGRRRRRPSCCAAAPAQPSGPRSRCSTSAGCGVRARARAAGGSCGSDLGSDSDSTPTPTPATAMAPAPCSGRACASAPARAARGGGQGLRRPTQ